jgi:hypothetical protein
MICLRHILLLNEISFLKKRSEKMSCTRNEARKNIDGYILKREKDAFGRENDIYL